MKRSLQTLLLFIIIGCTTETPKEDLPIMGDLSLGPHAVGYQTIFTYDKTRNGVPYAGWDDRLINDHDPSLGRQFQINVWYPAVAETGTDLTYRHFVHLFGQQTNFTATEGSRKKAEEVFISRTNGMGADGNFGQTQLEMLMDLRVLSRLDAEPLTGKFPVVVIPNGNSPWAHTILADYLASHGYLVVGFVPKGRFSAAMEVSTVGLEIAVDDMEFVLSQVSQLPNADMDRVTVGANAIRSSVCALAVARNDKIKALFSIEGGFPSAWEQRLLNRSAIYSPENIRVPVLVAYAPHPSIDPKYTFHLKYATRYYAHFPNMSEYVMLNYGMFERFIPNILGEHSGSTAAGLEIASQLVLKFLDQNMKNVGGELFDDEFLQAAGENIDTVFVHEALTAPLNIAETKNLYHEKGFEAIDSLYNTLRDAGDTQPFSKSFIHNMRSWLSWNGDDDYQHRAALYQFAYESYPSSASVNYYLALYSSRIDQNSKAMDHYQKTLELADGDLDLSASEKQRLRDNATEALAELR